MKKILVFDIWGEYAHFKKPYTTTSPITYSIPSRTSITGMLGAILGLPKNKNNILLSYDRAHIGVGIQNPIKKVMIAQNLIDTKKAKKMARINGRTQIRFEYVRNPKYRLYVQLEDEELHEALKGMLKAHQTVYTLSLGLSENLANFGYLGEYEYSVQKGEAQLKSAVNLEKIQRENIKLISGKEYFVDRFALEMTEEREVTRYGDILFERNGGSVDVKDTDYFALGNGENIVFI